MGAELRIPLRLDRRTNRIDASRLATYAFQARQEEGRWQGDGRLQIQPGGPGHRKDDGGHPEEEGEDGEGRKGCPIHDGRNL